jgi:hypothetical protein
MAKAAHTDALRIANRGEAQRSRDFPGDVFLPTTHAGVVAPVVLGGCDVSIEIQH